MESENAIVLKNKQEIAKFEFNLLNDKLNEFGYSYLDIVNHKINVEQQIQRFGNIKSKVTLILKKNDDSNILLSSYYSTVIDDGFMITFINP